MGDQDMMKYLGMLGLGGGFGQAAGGLASLFGFGGKNPADAASPYLNQIPDILKQYMNPYVNAGQGALGDLQNQFGQLTGNTSDVYNKLGAGYKESPGFQRNLEQALNAGSNAAAAGGMLGTPWHQQQNMGIASDIASKDYGDYMNRVMGLYGAGLSGQQGLSQLGFQGANNLSSGLGNVLGMQGQNAAAGQLFKNTQQSGGLSNLFGGLGMMAPFFLSKFGFGM